MTILYLRLPSRSAATAAMASAVSLSATSFLDPAGQRPDAQAAPPCAFALVAASGAIEQQGSAPLADLGDIVAGASRVVMLVAASDVSLLRIPVPPMSPARLRAALPNLVEEQLIGEASECVFVASAPLEGLRTVAVTARDWLQQHAAILSRLGAGNVSAVPAQLCLPWPAPAMPAAGAATATSAAEFAGAGGPAGVTAAIGVDAGAFELTLRLSPHEGIGLTVMRHGFGGDAGLATGAAASGPADAGDGREVLDALMAMAPGSPATVYVPGAMAAHFEALAASPDGLADGPAGVVANGTAAGAAVGMASAVTTGVAGGGAQSSLESLGVAGFVPVFDATGAASSPRLRFVADDWSNWIAGARAVRLDLMTGLVGNGGARTDWRPWRWTAILAALVLLVNAAAINYDWWRMAREAATLRGAINQIYRAAWPNETVIVDPVAQMQQKIALGKRGAGEAAPDDFTALAAHFGQAWNSLPTPPGQRASIAALDYRDRSLFVRFKAGAQANAGQMAQLRGALETRGLAMTPAASQTSSAVWQIQLSGK